MNYEGFESAEFEDRAYKVKGHRGFAWHALGWQTIPNEETEWSGYEVRTGRVVCAMVGDDMHFAFEPEDVTPLDDDAYCPSCGQIGCSWH
jgi:hypothetical protein